MAFTDLEEALDDAREGSGSSGNQDYEEYPRVKLTPEAAIGGTIVDVSFSGDIADEQNIRGEGFGGDFIFTIEDPTVIRGQLFEAGLRSEAEDDLIKNIDPDVYPFSVDRNAGAPTRDFRVVPSDWESTSHVSEMVKKLDGEYEQVGIEPYGVEYPAEPVDDFDDALGEYERIDVFVSGQAGRMMMTSIDATLAQSAYIDSDGNKTRGLIEYPAKYGTSEWDYEDDNFPRAARNPELHPEIEGEDIALFLHFGEMDITGDGEEDEGDDDDDGGEQTGYRKQYGDLLWDSDDGPVVLTQVDDVLQAEPSVVPESAMWLKFHEPEDGWGSSGGSSSDDDSGSSFDFDELDESGSSGDDSTTPTIDDLDTDTRNFVREAAEYSESTGGIDEAFGDFEETVANAVDQGEIADHEPSTLRTIVEAEMAA